MKLIDQRVRPAVVLAGRSTEKACLEARGIERLIRLDQVRPRRTGSGEQPSGADC